MSRMRPPLFDPPPAEKQEPEKLALTIGGPTFDAGDFWSMIDIRTTGTASVAATITALNTAVVGTASILNQRVFFTVKGYIKPNAAGTLSLKCRSEINLSACTVHKHAVGKLWKV